MDLVTGEYPDEWVRYAGYADAPLLNSMSEHELERSGSLGDVRRAAKRYGCGAEPFSAAFVATEAALYYALPFARQHYRFEWPAITEMDSHNYGRRDARKAGLPESGTWVFFFVPSRRCGCGWMMLMGKYFRSSDVHRSTAGLINSAD
jgi:hypothetical protein